MILPPNDFLLFPVDMGRKLPPEVGPLPEGYVFLGHGRDTNSHRRHKIRRWLRWAREWIADQTGMLDHDLYACPSEHYETLKGFYDPVPPTE